MQLAYTIAIDTPDAGGNRLMAKMLAMSLLRSQFDGDVLIFRSGEVPIFHLPRVGLYEYELPVPDGLAGRAMAVAVMSAGLTERWSKSFAPDESLFGTQLCLMGWLLEDGATMVAACCFDPINDLSGRLYKTRPPMRRGATGHWHFFHIRRHPVRSNASCGLNTDSKASIPAWGRSCGGRWLSHS
jgi:hypothetical protein